jgi:Sensors of blue-light using FAD
MSELINLIYGSSASQTVTDDVLLEILRKARQKNQRLGITGMLLYRGGNFLQVLEGDKDVVNDLYTVIERDPRHHHVQLFVRRPVAERGFGEWEMDFVQMDHINPAEVEGLSTFLSEPLDSKRFKDAKFAYIFLNAFKTGVR